MRGASALERRSIADAVFALLRQQIIVGELPPGQKLTEQELSSSLGVSRTPIREALRMLLGEALVEKRPSGGFGVTAISVRDVTEAYNVRALLEGLMVRDATPKLTAEDVSALRALIDEMRAVDPDAEAVAKVSRRFHARIQAVADNHRAQSALDQLRSEIDRYRALAALGPRRPHESV
ncbi:MAG: GntR family transcriptional regulator, partial [Propionibacteriaceae bacterium]|nr:GntR family transcriptional regulator [Propionibacteriaceae bacterium]